ncbi:Hypothetical protein Tpal_653 [Trichococcus palustris]|uniref:Uncharacterized protein n=1 Tax=Trichococcus palustris TaxID=140314 RepID=A0A143YCG9_9LACT|nr:hypothetical protein [Trichococcus palustris]CZQ85582.1 Hypothetical protein Tpal_653 [Trichococcus palustris]SFK56333.1 hypothetical protein SAMN04488076_101135 [Trichococcus palustris]
MVSVTNRIAQVKQPRGGYIKPKDFKLIELNDSKELYPDENTHSTIVGLAVDYLTRFTMGTPAKEAFKISILGSMLVHESDHAMALVDAVIGLDDSSIINACKLAGFDVARRAGVAAYRPVGTILPDYETISNIRIMVERGTAFLKEFGPIVKDGFTFEGGYTQTVSSGDGDFLTESTLWDFKVSKKEPTNKHTLQLLMYYLMGSRSIHEEFQNVEKLGIFNPRLNKVYLLNINGIPSEVITEVASDVIGY